MILLLTPDNTPQWKSPRYFYDVQWIMGNIIPIMRISKETGLPEKIIDKSLSESFVSRMNVCQPIPITPDVPILETVNSLKMGEVHFDTSKDSSNLVFEIPSQIPQESQTGQGFTKPIALDFKCEDKEMMKGLKRQKEAKTIKNQQETGKRQRDKSKSEKSAKDHSRISPTQSKKEIKEVKSQITSQRAFSDKCAKVWKSVRYGVSKGLDTAYWAFLKYGPRLISSRIFTYYISNMAYWSSLDTTYWASFHCGLWVDPSSIFHQKYHSNKAAEAHLHGCNDGIDMCVQSHPHSNLTNG
ncbi:hypothetical protein Tco_0454190 [Tanacetum coccineum]